MDGDSLLGEPVNLKYYQLTESGELFGTEFHHSLCLTLGREDLGLKLH